MMFALFMENFHLACWNKLMAVRLISVFWAQKTFDFYFLDMMYVVFLKNFLLDDSSELLAVTLILAS